LGSEASLAALAARRPRLALAQRDEGHLGRGEEPANGHDDKDDQHVQDDLGHCVIADLLPML